MRKKEVVKPEGSSRKGRPAMSPEARENQLIALAVDLAEQQLRNGTASSQVITHYLKLGSTKERLEMEKIKNENLLLQVKADSIKKAESMDAVYKEALAAMREYSGNGKTEDD